VSESATRFYTQLADFYEELFPAETDTIDLLERTARRAALSSRHAPQHTRERRNDFPAPRVLDAGCGTGGHHHAVPFNLVYTLGNTISHLPSHEDATHWIHTVTSALASGGALILQFMDVTSAPVGETLRLPDLTATTRDGSVSLERRYLRKSAARVRFDATLRRPDSTHEHAISNDLLVLSTDEVVRTMNMAGFREITVNSSSWSRTVCGTIGDM
jgi:hypothetical protein